MGKDTSSFDLPVQVQAIFAIFAVLLIADLNSLTQRTTISDYPAPSSVERLDLSTEWVARSASTSLDRMRRFDAPPCRSRLIRFNCPGQALQEGSFQNEIPQIRHHCRSRGCLRLRFPSAQTNAVHVDHRGRIFEVTTEKAGMGSVDDTGRPHHRSTATVYRAPTSVRQIVWQRVTCRRMFTSLRRLRGSGKLQRNLVTLSNVDALSATSTLGRRFLLAPLEPDGLTDSYTELTEKAKTVRNR